MIKYVKGNLLESPAKVLVNTVNTVGVMGKGIAKEFKEAYPKMFLQYKKICDSNLLEVGKLWIYYTEDKWILNFPTKKHWRSKSQYEYIEMGLQKFVDTYRDRGITSIAFPKLGCGNGDLDWELVKPIMEEYLGKLPIDIYVYEEFYTAPELPEHKAVERTIDWIKRDPRNISFEIFINDLKSIDNTLKYELDTTTFILEELEKIWIALNYSGYYILNINDFTNVDLGEIVFHNMRKLPYIKECLIKIYETGEFVPGFHLKN